MTVLDTLLDSDWGKCELIHTRISPTGCIPFLIAIFGGTGIAMPDKIIDEYRKLNSEDQRAFRRWFWTNAVVGAILVAGLIALASKFSGDRSVSIAQTPESNHPSPPNAH
jgi:hypothetical protein